MNRPPDAAPRGGAPDQTVAPARSRARRGRLMVIALLLVGAALRLWRPGQIPPGLYHDEAENGLDALAVLAGEPQLYFEANNGREPLFIYLISLSVAVLGRSPLAIRLPAFFAGFLTLAATYDLARTLWGRRAGRWTLAILSVTLWHVHLSRVGFRAVLLPLLTALCFSQVVKGMQRRGAKMHWVAAGALYGASWYTYNAARFTPIALGVLLAYGLLAHRTALLAYRREIALAGGIALLVLLPLGLYTLARPDVVLARSGQVSIFSQAIHGGRFWATLGRHTMATLGMFAVQGDRIWRHNVAWRPVWEPALGLAFTLGVGVALARLKHDAALAAVLLWTATMALPTLLAEDAPHFLRGVGVLPTAALLPAVGLDWLVGQSGYRPRIARALPVAFIVAGLGSTAYDYFVRYPAEPLAHHWFEAGPAQLAGEINRLIGEGWDGTLTRHGSTEQPTEIYIDRQLWEGWASLPFLLQASAVELLPVDGVVPANVTFVVWPYRDWAGDVLPYLPHPAYLQVHRGPEAQGDLDPAPYSMATLVSAAPRPDLPPPVAIFDDGIVLRAALVRPHTSSPTSPYAAGALVHIWWEATGTPARDLTVFVHYLRDGARIGQHDGQPGFGHLTTTIWQAGDVILDLHPVPGVVPFAEADTLNIGLYDPTTGEGLELLSSDFPSRGNAVELPVILIAPAER